MDKRRKSAYIEYNYEAAYQKKLHNLEEVNAEKMLKEGKVKSLYATKEIRAGGQLEVEIYPEFSRSQKDLIPDEAKKKKQRQAQRDLNDKNSQKECIRTIEENFTDQDIWGTLTYTDDTMPDTEEEADRNMVNYIKRLNYRRKKMNLPNLRYVYTTECSDRGRWHHHIVLDGDMGMHYIFYCKYGIAKKLADKREETICTAASLIVLYNLYPGEFMLYDKYVRECGKEKYVGGADLAMKVNYDINTLADMI